jgi:hypothetical protein
MIMERTVNLNLGSFSLRTVVPPAQRQGSVLLNECNWHIGKSIQTREVIAGNTIIVFLLNQQTIPFSLDLCMDISNICNSRQMYPHIVTATDHAQWYRSGLETIMVPSIDHIPPDIENLFAPDVTVEISKFISVFGRDVCRYGGDELSS